MLEIAPGWELDLERGPDWLLVKIKGPDEVEPGNPPLADQLWTLLRRHFTYRLVLELDQIKLLDNYLIDQLLELHERVCRHDGVMRLCGLSPYNRRVLQARQCSDCFVLYRDREEAVLGCSHPHQPR